MASDVRIGDLTWDLWATASNSYIAFVPADGRSYPSGRLNLTAYLDYLIGQGMLPADTTLGQLGYGIEFVSTGGGTGRFTCSDFSVSPPHRGVET